MKKAKGNITIEMAETSDRDLRTECAMRNLAAILSNSAYQQFSLKEKIDIAVNCADALMDRLNK